MTDFVTRRSLVIAIVSGTLLLALLFFAALARSTTGRLKILVTGLQAFSETALAQLAITASGLQRGELIEPSAPSLKKLPTRGRDELTAASKTLNEMLASSDSAMQSFIEGIQSLSLLISGVKGASEASVSGSKNVKISADEISSSAKDVSSAIDQVATASTEIAQGTAIQAEAVNHSGERLRWLSEQITSVASTASSTALVAKNAKIAATTGATTVESALNAITVISESVKQTASTMDQLGKASAQIGNIVETINSIADQTNLLALNAAIEAARVGDAGKGFAVVAQEVRNLAQMSRAAATEISGLIIAVQTDTSSAIKSIKSGVEVATNGAEQAAEAGRALSQITETVTLMDSQMANILVLTNEMAQTSDQATASLNDVTAVIEETSAAAEQMSASAIHVAESTKEQFNAANKLVLAAGSMETIADKLFVESSRFKILNAA